MSSEQKVDPIGGQAVIEGVMMRGKTLIAMAVRSPDHKIVIEKYPFISWSKKYPILGLVFIRGFVTLIEMLIIGSKLLMRSAEIAMPEEAGKKISPLELFLTYTASFILFIAFFLALPAFFFTKLRAVVDSVILLNVCEGLVRLSIFLIFLAVVSLMKDMRRVFAYHGAEHKVVNMYEHKEILTIENARKFSVRHPRCGTSFLLVVMVVSIIVFTFLGRPDLLHRILYKLLLMPVVSGISYEFIRLTAKLKSGIFGFLTWPGMLVQFFTTREPTDDQVEVAIKALETVVEA